MDIDTSRSMSSEAAKYLRYAKQCAKAAERTTDPKVRERLIKVVADLTAAALSAALGATTSPKPGPSRVGEQG
jgi:sarcosine oxidase gamma subunit